MSNPVMSRIRLLCGNDKVLINSHVWSSFAYRRYAASQSRGGNFFDLAELREHNKQYKRPWFCEACDNGIIGRTMESPVARLCSRLDANPTASQPYGDYLLKFAVSISWRTVKLLRENMNRQLLEDIWPACRIWRQFLRGTRADISLHSQHIFVVFDQEKGLHKALGGGIFEEKNFVVSQIGPLFIVGLLSRRGFSSSELKIWRRSEIHQTGGTITPLTEWRVGGSITADLTQILIYQENWAINGIMNIVQNRKKR